MAKTETPTSAKTAAHIVASPKALKTKTPILTVIAKTIFCLTIFIVLLEMFIALAIFDGSSVIITTSAASIAASLPKPPIATPISAKAKTGASLIPSPTKTTFPSFVF